MAWVSLLFAGLFEIVWAWAMKASDGFSKPWAVVLMLATMGLSFALLAHAMRVLPLGTAYAIWTGIGALGAFAVGILVLGEPATALRILAAVLILSGIVLLKLAT
jgi:quaternary ammonium compound-resistance protein SugE